MIDRHHPSRLVSYYLTREIDATDNGCRKPQPGKSGRLAKAVFSAFDQPSEIVR